MHVSSQFYLPMLLVCVFSSFYLQTANFSRVVDSSASSVFFGKGRLLTLVKRRLFSLVKRSLFSLILFFVEEAPELVHCVGTQHTPHARTRAHAHTRLPQSDRAAAPPAERKSQALAGLVASLPRRRWGVGGVGRQPHRGEEEEEEGRTNGEGRRRAAPAGRGGGGPHRGQKEEEEL